MLYRAHVAKGMYAIQLERWFTLFGRENVKVGVKNVFLCLPLFQIRVLKSGL